LTAAGLIAPTGFHADRFQLMLTLVCVTAVRAGLNAVCWPSAAVMACDPKRERVVYWSPGGVLALATWEESWRRETESPLAASGRPMVKVPRSNARAEVA